MKIIEKHLLSEIAEKEVGHRIIGALALLAVGQDEVIDMGHLDIESWFEFVVMD